LSKCDVAFSPQGGGEVALPLGVGGVLCSELLTNVFAGRESSRSDVESPLGKEYVALIV
jgi:hypothetical protein